MTTDRKDILLRAALDLLMRSDRSPIVLDASEILLHYDGVDCDGYCLMVDIASELNIDTNIEDPIPLTDSENYEG